MYLEEKIEFLEKENLDLKQKLVQKNTSGIEELIQMKPKSYIIGKKEAKEVFGDCESVFYDKCKEIREQIRLGRYSHYAISADKKNKVNMFVYYDYTFFRDMLKDSKMQKYVPPFEPEEIVKLFPMGKKVIIANI